MSVNVSTPQTGSLIRRQQHRSMVRLGRGDYDSEEESRLLNSLPDGLRTRLLFSESSSRNSEQPQTQILNSSLDLLRAMAASQSPPTLLEEQVEQKRQPRTTMRIVEEESDQRDVLDSNKSIKEKLEAIKKSTLKYLSETEWMFCGPRYSMYR
eukprot:TRINITY_DN13463_c0_g1_i11.p3 TRINITY_DN13463_c0_g1~~TRINITY_DN13463_c0_g1_i11.p3  ORF type:complete len:153 (+),score=12.20 TRINITY_DN13463_c0_g1_i11:128-586(+)